MEDRKQIFFVTTLGSLDPKSAKELRRIQDLRRLVPKDPPAVYRGQELESVKLEVWLRLPKASSHAALSSLMWEEQPSHAVDKFMELMDSLPGNSVCLVTAEMVQKMRSVVSADLVDELEAEPGAVYAVLFSGGELNRIFKSTGEHQDWWKRLA